jgi:HK97 family phage major capsid protein
MSKEERVAERVDAHAELKDVLAALDRRDAEITAFAERANAEIKQHGRVLSDTSETLTKLARDGGELNARLADVEQKLARRGGGASEPPKTNGQLLTESEDFADLKKRGRGRAGVQVRSVTDLTSLTTGTGGVGSALVPDRLPGVIAPPNRPMTIRDLITPGRTSAGSIQYLRESGFQNKAAMVAEGNPKPQSDLSFEEITSPVRTLAHWVRATRQILEDVPMLQSYVDGRLRYGLQYVEENEILNGDGTGQHLDGLLANATAFNNVVSTDSPTEVPTLIDALRIAALQVRIAEYAATGIVLNPIDWARIEMEKDVDGRYLWVNIQNGGSPQMWRLPVIDTNAMPVGEFMVGAFAQAAQVFDREEASVAISIDDGDNFTKNMTTILAEERLALAVYRPESFVHGSFF